MITSGSIKLVDTMLLECHSDSPSKCSRMIREIKLAAPAITLVHEQKAFREHEDIDAESRVPSAAVVAKRIAACNAAAAGGFSLYQRSDSPHHRRVRAGSADGGSDGSGGGGGGGEAADALEGQQSPAIGAATPTTAAASMHTSGSLNRRRRGADFAAAALTLAARGSPSSVTTAAFPPAAALLSSECVRLHALYSNYTKRGPCPFDRHLVEQIAYLDGCPPPGLRLCIARSLRVATPGTNPASIPPANADAAAAVVASRSVNNDVALADSALEWRDFRPLRGFADVTFAAKTGKVPGLHEPKDGQSWAGVEYSRPRASNRTHHHTTATRLHAMRPSLALSPPLAF